MNHERMLTLADEIENPTVLRKVVFNMANFIFPSGGLDTHAGSCYFTGHIKDYECGTACCIGGWAVLLFGKPTTYIGEMEARKLLDLTKRQCDQLFYNHGSYITDPEKFPQITRSEAAAAIRRMVEEDHNA